MNGWKLNMSEMLRMCVMLSGLYTPAVYVYEKAVQELGASKAKASIILSILGVCDTFGRAASGLLAGRRWTNSLYISSVATIVAGLLTCLVPVIFSFELICIYAAFYSVFIGKFLVSAVLTHRYRSTVSSYAVSKTLHRP